MPQKIIVRKNEYHDSIQLMRVSETLRKTEGVIQVMVAMATDTNKQILSDIGLTSPAVEKADKNDMVAAIRAQSEDVIEAALAQMEDIFRHKNAKRDSRHNHATFQAALEASPDANLCVISIPGEYAFDEARKALQAGLHLFIYSDNVPMEQERQLKELAREKGLLCMGPDCGVANINRIALGTASVAGKGSIGIVGASGSGTQQIAVLVDREGVGVSQVIGVGGKDLKDDVGGIEMLFGIDALEEDPDTGVIVLVSRVPGSKTQAKILDRIHCCSKPVVVYFIGGDSQQIKNAGGIPADNSEDAAYKAVAIAKGQSFRTSLFSQPKEEIDEIVSRETASLFPEQKYLRGLFCGGTFCEEALSILGEIIGDTWSNVPLKKERKLKDSLVSKEHTIIDLGDEEFMVGRAHPVIDPTSIRSAILREGKYQDVAVLLMDFILGPAINPDPVGSVLDCIERVKAERKKAGGHLSIVASVCGTEGDPQKVSDQEKKLRDAGVIVMPSNAQAARLSGFIIKRLSERR
jgi:FdrA protein